MELPRDTAQSGDDHSPDAAKSTGTRGDAREAVAHRLLAQQSTLLARIRRQLSPTTAAQKNADDIFSTTLRRTDAMVAADALVANLSDDALLALATVVSRRAILEAARSGERQRRRDDAALDLARSRADDASNRLAPTDPARLERLAEADLAILTLRLRGADWPVIAKTLDTTPAGAHRRYYRALKALADADARK